MAFRNCIKNKTQIYLYESYLSSVSFFFSSLLALSSVSTLSIAPVGQESIASLTSSTFSALTLGQTTLLSPSSSISKTSGQIAAQAPQPIQASRLTLTSLVSLPH